MKKLILTVTSILMMATSCSKDELDINDNDNNNNNGNQISCECGTVVEVGDTYGVTSTSPSGVGVFTMYITLKVRNNCSNTLENFQHEYPLNQYYVTDEYCAGYEW